MFKGLVLALGFAAISVSGLAQAEQKLAPVEFMDQWEQPQLLSAETKWLIFTDTKDAGSWVKDTLEALDVEDMSTNNWLYVADVSGMPSLITRFMAIPKMKDYKFSIALEREGDLTKDWPKQEDAVNIYQLNALTVEKVHTFTNEEDVMSFLKSI